MSYITLSCHGAGLSRPALSVTPKHSGRLTRFGYVVLFVLFCLSTHTFSQSVPLPSIVYIEGEDFHSVWPFVNTKKHLGTMEISNSAGVPFILRVTLLHGSKLVSWHNINAIEPFISLHELELRYRNPNSVQLNKLFSSAVGGSDGYVYELEFLQEDVQPFYRMELWGFLNPTEARRAVAGNYREEITFEILEKK